MASFRVENLAGESLWPCIEEIVRIFDPAAQVGDGDFLYALNKKEFSHGLAVTAKSKTGNVLTVEESWQEDEEPEHQGRRVLRLALYRMLQKEWGGGSPWGILTGVRPMKIMRRLLAAGQGTEEVLCRRYALTPSKAALLLACSEEQKFYWRKAPYRGRVGVYVGIPFCPTRCSYCSFAGVALDKNQKLVKPYLDALKQEITDAGAALKEVGWQVDSLYVGGGTPSSLTVAEMAEILWALNCELPMANCREFTVEAGRPDTLNEEKWRLLRDAGVGRVSVNPQTKHRATLERIGRQHTPKQVEEEVRRGQELGFAVNMDLIAGLPGEEPEEFRQSLEWALALHPANLTVHTLALKRGSRLRENCGQEEFTAAVGEMLDFAGSALAKADYKPYYLYRQKNTLDFLENVGYTKPGQAGIYNIAVMDEQQVIVGLGVGAGSKWVLPDGTLTATYNPKDILCYLERSKNGGSNKIDKLRQLIYNNWE